MPVDAHVHFFTRSLLSEKVGRWMSILRTTSLAEGLVRREDRGSTADPAALLDMVEAGLKDSAETTLEDIDQCYGEGWSYVPLMVDFEYALANEPDSREIQAGPFWTPGPVLNLGWENEWEFQIRQKIWQSVEKVWKTIFGDALEVGVGEVLAPGSFESQKNELIALKEDLPDRIFPFLSLDPRRQHLGGVNLAELAGDCVGPGRPFAGVKLYAAAGFSPTDPALAAPGGLYSHCSRHKIPLTVHFSPGGFASPFSEVRVRGDVYHPLYAAVVPVEEVYPEGRVVFHQKMSPGNIREAVTERQMKLNHPLLWEKVLKRYPNLIINFAHAGGAPQISLFSRCPDAGWTSWLLGMAERYRGVYMDLSAYAGSAAELVEFAEHLQQHHPRLRRKILYGSDYFLSLMKNPDVRLFRDMHEKALGNWWPSASIDNPAEFLSGGTGRKPSRWWSFRKRQ